MVDDETDRGSSKDGVFVYTDKSDDGVVSVNFQVLGYVDPLAIPSMMEHAVRLARRRIGLPVSVQ